VVALKPLDCGEAREVAPEFALGVLDGDTRSEVVQHLDRCPACRTAVTELAETADAIVLLAPEAEPPVGFERRVMEKITGSERRRRWRTVKLVAAVAAAAAILSVVTVRVIDQSRSDPTVAAPAATTVAMVGGGGLRVGQVDVVPDGSMSTLSLVVDYALPDGEYRVALDPAGGGRRILGTVTVAGSRGAWSGSASLGGQAAQLALVDVDGRVQCSADLPA
jgi:predicted anti-sigma-YlaC factor YlaD